MMRSGRDGFVLVSTLAVLIVLSGLVGAAGYLVRVAVVEAAAAREKLGADALLRAGVEIAGYRLFVLEEPAEALTGQRVRLDGGVVTLFATAENGKIDLNGAPRELLESLWRSSGYAELTAAAFAARVVDYRDADRERTPNGGAEAPDYAAAGVVAVPADAPFGSVDDLQNVLGVSAARVQALAPLLTVHNPGGAVSAENASPGVLRALPDGAAPARRPRASRAGAGGPAAAGDDAEAGRDTRLSAAYTVRIEVVRGESRRLAEVVLTKSVSADALFYVTDWRDLAR